MTRLFILLFVLLAGCATSSRESATSQPEFKSPAEGAVYVVAVRELDGTKKVEIVDHHYTSVAIHLATHSRTKIPKSAAPPIGKGYRMVFQLLDGSVIEQFDFWPEEVVVHGQRWRIEDKTTAWRARMMWFDEFPKEPNQPTEPTTGLASASAQEEAQAVMTILVVRIGRFFERGGGRFDAIECDIISPADFRHLPANLVLLPSAASARFSKEQGRYAKLLLRETDLKERLALGLSILIPASLPTAENPDSLGEATPVTMKLPKKREEPNQ